MSEIITLTQQVPAGPAKVWEALTTVDGLASWWWPFAPDTTYALQLHEGGHYAITSAAYDIGVSGQFYTIERAQALNLTWLWQGSVDPDAVRIELEEQDGGTLVTVKHSLRDPENDRGPIAQGWGDVLSRLGQITDETSFAPYQPTPAQKPTQGEKPAQEPTQGDAASDVSPDDAPPPVPTAAGLASTAPVDETASDHPQSND